MLMSGGGVWVLQHGGRATSMPPVAAVDRNRGVAPCRRGSRIRATTKPSRTSSRHSRRDGRSSTPTTINILEANLAIIDKAIEDSRKALDADPANVYLNNHLADARQRKLALLRRATALVETKG